MAGVPSFFVVAVVPAAWGRRPSYFVGVMDATNPCSPQVKSDEPSGYCWTVGGIVQDPQPMTRGLVADVPKAGHSPAGDERMSLSAGEPSPRTDG